MAIDMKILDKVLRDDSVIEKICSSEDPKQIIMGLKDYCDTIDTCRECAESVAAESTKEIQDRATDKAIYLSKAEWVEVLLSLERMAYESKMGQDKDSFNRFANIITKLAPWRNQEKFGEIQSMLDMSGLLYQRGLQVGKIVSKRLAEITHTSEDKVSLADFIDGENKENLD